jgi:hypothetical protein
MILMVKHTYTRQANFTAFMVFRGLKPKEEFLKNYLNHGIGSLNCRIANYQCMAGLNDYHGISKDARAIYMKYSQVSDEILLYLYQHFLTHV